MAYNNAEDDLDTNDTVDLLNGTSREVSGQGDYMGSGGSPVVNANYATEDGGGQNERIRLRDLGRGQHVLAATGSRQRKQTIALGRFRGPALRFRGRGADGP